MVFCTVKSVRIQPNIANQAQIGKSTDFIAGEIQNFLESGLRVVILYKAYHTIARSVPQRLTMPAGALPEVLEPVIHESNSSPASVNLLEFNRE